MEVFYFVLVVCLILYFKAAQFKTNIMMLIKCPEVQRSPEIASVYSECSPFVTAGLTYKAGPFPD